MPETASRPLRIFLCHSSADKPAAVELYDYLLEKGMDPWLDVEKLMPGQKWQIEIPRALEASDVIIVVLSSDSITREGYVQKEIKFALDRALEMPEDRIFLIPARLEDCKIPASLQGYQWVDLFEKNWAKKLTRSLNVRAVQLKLIDRPNPDWDDTSLPAPLSKGRAGRVSALSLLPAAAPQQAAEPPSQPAAPNPAKKRSLLRTAIRTLLIIAGLLLFFFLGIIAFFMMKYPQGIPVVYVTDTLPTPTFDPSTATPSPTPDPNAIQPGTYLIGTDIQPGLYRGAAEKSVEGHCSWARLKNLQQDQEAKLGEGFELAQYYVEIKESDYAFKTDCQMTRLDSLPVHAGEYPELIQPGDYLVGSDIRPGTYRQSPGSDKSSSCYWARLMDFTGDTGTIIANDIQTGQVMIQIVSSDYGFSTSCEMEWIGE
jgi:hypothetical protein